MTILGTTHALAVAPQTAKGTAAAVDAATWRWLKLLEDGISVNQAQNMLPPELSGRPIQGGAYKAGYFTGGAIRLIPRLQTDAMHWILGSFGSSIVETQIDVEPDATPDNVYERIYGGGSLTPATWASDFDYDDATMLASGGGDNETARWLSIKRRFAVNQGSSDTATGELAADFRVGSLDFMATAGQPLVATAGLLGRTSTYYDTATGANWTPGSFETDAGVALTCVNAPFNFSDSTITMDNVTSARVQCLATLTPPQSQQVLHSYVPYDYAISARNMIVTLQLNMKAWTMYRDILYGDPAAGIRSWTPVVWEAATPKPFYLEFRTASSTYIDSKVPGSIGFWGKEMVWAAAPIQPRPGQITGLTLVGQMKRRDDNYVEWFIRTVTGTAMTAWPS